MNDRQHFDIQPEWVGFVRTSAEITLAVASGVLGVLDALDRHQQLEDHGAQEPSLLPAPVEKKEGER